MRATKQVTIVLRPPLSFSWEDFDVLDVHGGDPAGKPGHLSDAEWVRSELDTMGVLAVMWGDVWDVPPEVAIAEKVLVLGHMERDQCGSPLDGYEDECWFEIDSYRVLK